MTAHEQLLTLAFILNASELQELMQAVSCYESNGTVMESKSKVVTSNFALIKGTIDDERRAAELLLSEDEDRVLTKSEKRSLAGKIGAMKRWQKMANDSKNSKMANAINAISSHSEPYFAINDTNREETEETPLPPVTPITEEEKEDPLIEKEKLSKESIKEKDSPQEIPLSSGNRPSPAKEEKEGEKEEGKFQRYGRSEFMRDMMAEGVSRQTVTDWFAARDKKRLPYTKTAFEATVREMRKIPEVPPEDLIKRAAENGWGGFKEEYWNNSSTRQQNNNGNRPQQTDYRIHADFESEEYRKEIADWGTIQI